LKKSTRFWNNGISQRKFKQHKKRPWHVIYS
jgi:hypothetical protein